MGEEKHFVLELQPVPFHSLARTMLKVTPERLEKLDADYPGLRDYVLELEAAVLPGCSLCGSDNTAQVNVGVIGRTIALAAATSRFKLVPNRPKPGAYFCHDCRSFFDGEG